MVTYYCFFPPNQKMFLDVLHVFIAINNYLTSTCSQNQYLLNKDLNININTVYCRCTSINQTLAGTKRTPSLFKFKTSKQSNRRFERWRLAIETQNVLREGTNRTQSKRDVKRRVESYGKRQGV